MWTRCRQSWHAGAHEDVLRQLRARARALDERVAPVRALMRHSAPAADAISGEPLSVGDMVYVPSMGQRGEVLSIADAHGHVAVQLGALKLRVAEADVARLSRRQAQSESSTPAINLPPARPATLAPDLQLDLRGTRVEDGLEAVERYLNDAALAGMPFVRILHGKGTGALRQAIRQQLAHHPLVRSFAPAEANDGGDGVTVVSLAS